MSEVIKNIENNREFGRLPSGGINIPINIDNKKFAIIVYKSGKILPKYHDINGWHYLESINIEPYNFEKFNTSLNDIIKKVIPGISNIPEEYIKITYKYHFGSTNVTEKSKEERQIIKKEIIIISNEEVEVIPKEGENIEKLLGRYGLNYNGANKVFIEINNLNKNSILSATKIYKLPIINNTIKKGQSFKDILIQKGLNIKHSTKILNYNIKYNPEFSDIKKINGNHTGLNILIPMWSTGFYEPTIKENKSKKIKTTLPKKNEKRESTKLEVIKKENTSSINKQTVKINKVTEQNDTKKGFNYIEWINSIEIVSNELKDKIFVLDAGHGAIDGGANPEGKDSEGKKYKVMEAPSVLDITYRLAEYIRKRGGDVYLTHYSKARGVSDETNLGKVPLYSDVYLSNSKTWSPKIIGGVKGSKRSLKKRSIYANNILLNNTSKEAFFLSIHADYDPNSTKNNPITFKYYRGKNGIDKEGQQFSSNLSKHMTVNGSTNIVNGQGLYVIDDNNNQIKNKTLIELVNLRNHTGANKLIKSEGRQYFAELIGNGLVNLVKEKKEKITIVKSNSQEKKIYN